MLEQAWDGIAVAIKVLALSIAALVLAFIVPGLGLILGWMIASYAIGRGLFVAVAMRRMPRAMAELLYLQHRGIVLAQGGDPGAGRLHSDHESFDSGHRRGCHGPYP